MNVKNSEAALVGIVLGAVWLIMGFTYENNGLLMLGGLILGIGLFFKFKKFTKNLYFNIKINIFSYKFKSFKFLSFFFFKFFIIKLYDHFSKT